MPRLVFLLTLGVTLLVCPHTKRFGAEAWAQDLTFSARADKTTADLGDPINLTLTLYDAMCLGVRDVHHHARRRQQMSGSRNPLSRSQQRSSQYVSGQIGSKILRNHHTCQPLVKDG